MSFQDEINAVIRREVESRIDRNSEVIDKQANILFELRGKLESVEDERDALQQKLDAVVAENVALKGFFETGINASFEGCDFFGDHIQSRALELGLIREAVYCKDQHENLVVDPGNFEEGDAVFFINENPATDVTLNAVRADGVEIFSAHYKAEADKYDSNLSREISIAAKVYANRLRADAAKGDSDE